MGQGNQLIEPRGGRIVGNTDISASDRRFLLPENGVIGNFTAFSGHPEISWCITVSLVKN